jgi:hypothetical protein
MYITFLHTERTHHKCTTGQYPHYHSKSKRIHNAFHTRSRFGFTDDTTRCSKSTHYTRLTPILLIVHWTIMRFWMYCGFQRHHCHHHTQKFPSDARASIQQHKTMAHRHGIPTTTVSDPPFQWAGGAIGADTAAQLVAFAHASMFSPSLSTLAQALQKGLRTWHAGTDD